MISVFSCLTFTHACGNIELLFVLRLYLHGQQLRSCLDGQIRSCLNEQFLDKPLRGRLQVLSTFEPPYGKTKNLPRRKQRRRSASRSQISFAVNAKLISAFVFATRIAHFLFILNPKVQASSLILCLYSLICVRPGRKPHCWFSHAAAHFFTSN